MSRVVVIAVYFGALPRWMPLWLESCRRNGSLDFLVVTDQPTDVLPEPGNVTFVPLSFPSFVAMASARIGVPIVRMDPYKACDLRPMYGLILEDRIRGYDYWGHCDLDVLFGDIRKFLDLHGLERYDRFLDRGHFSLYRNRPSVNARFRAIGDAPLRDILSTSRNRFFDELLMHRLYARYRWPHFDACLYVDLDPYRVRFRNCAHRGGAGNHRHQIHYWENGRLVRAYVSHGVVREEERLYIHFQKRRMPRVPETPAAAYFLVDEGFIEKVRAGPPRRDEIRRLNGPFRPLASLRRIGYALTGSRFRTVRDYCAAVLWYARIRIVRAGRQVSRNPERHSRTVV